jgi:hypothetical protein
MKKLFKDLKKGDLLFSVSEISVKYIAYTIKNIEIYNDSVTVDLGRFNILLPGDKDYFLSKTGHSEGKHIFMSRKGALTHRDKYSLRHQVISLEAEMMAICPEITSEDIDWLPGKLNRIREYINNIKCIVDKNKK